MCRLSWNLVASSSWKPQGLSRPVMGLLYLFLPTQIFPALNRVPCLQILRQDLQAFRSCSVRPLRQIFSALTIFMTDHLAKTNKLQPLPFFISNLKHGPQFYFPPSGWQTKFYTHKNNIYETVLHASRFQWRPVQSCNNIIKYLHTNQTGIVGPVAVWITHAYFHKLQIKRFLLHSSYLTLRRLMSYIYIYIYMEDPFLMFLDHTQRRSTVGRTPLDEW